jgi:TetR/AcrR family transcriptional regulator, transcriptional repressor of bet genes
MAEHGTADRILDAVVEILGTRGLEGVTIRDVASTAGFSVGAVQHHFPTKQQMLAAALDRAADQVVAGLDRALVDVTDPQDRLRTGLSTLAAVGRSDRRAAVLWTAIASQSAVDPEISARFAQMQQGIRAWMRDRVAEAAPAADAPEGLAALLVATAQGAMVASVSEAGDGITDGPSRAITDRLLESVLPDLVAEATR